MISVWSAVTHVTDGRTVDWNTKPLTYGHMKKLMLSKSHVNVYFFPFLAHRSPFLSRYRLKAPGHYSIMILQNRIFTRTVKYYISLSVELLLSQDDYFCNLSASEFVVTTAKGSSQVIMGSSLCTCTGSFSISY